MSGNLPDGTTQADIDRAHDGSDRPEEEEEEEIWPDEFYEGGEDGTE